MTRKREETVAESKLLFWLWRRESEASGEGSATPRRRARGAPASPGPAVSSLSPSPGPALAAGSVLLAVPSAARQPLEPGSRGRSAETGRPKTPRAAPTPRNAGPGPGGRRGRARRAGLGARAPLASSLQPGLRAAGRAPGYSPVAEEGFRGMGPLALPLLPERPLPRIDRAATGPAAGKVLC